jgi:hypothetical protein
MLNEMPDAQCAMQSPTRNGQCPTMLNVPFVIDVLGLSSSIGHLAFGIEAKRRA